MAKAIEGCTWRPANSLEPLAVLPRSEQIPEFVPLGVTNTGTADVEPAGKVIVVLGEVHVDGLRVDMATATSLAGAHEGLMSPTCTAGPPRSSTTLLAL